MRADLHLHTVYSDGRLTPEEVVSLAKERGVGLIAFTDHDTMAGYERKRAAARAAGVLLTDGIEISAYAGCKVHVTGYRCDPEGEAYGRFLRERAESSVARAKDILRKLRALGISLSLEEAEAERPMPDSPLHTMHIARAVHKKGVCADEFAVYNTLLARGKPAFSDVGRPTPEDAVRIIHACGGIACLAHPGRIEMEGGALEKLLCRLADLGLDGIEAVYSSHTVEETERFRELARRYGLLVTGGSDLHQRDMGRQVGSPLFEPDERLLEALRISRGA